MSLRVSFLLATFVFVRLALAATHAGPEIPLSPVDDIPASGTQWSPAIASRGEEAFAVWTNGHVDVRGDLVGSRIGADGRLLDPRGLLLNDGDASRNAQVAWNGSEYLVVSTEWNSRQNLYPTWAHRVSAEGRLIERFLLGSFIEATLAGNGREHVLAVTIPGESFLAYLGSDGRIREKVPLYTFSPFAVVPDGDDWVIFTNTQCNPAVYCNSGLYQFRVRGRNASFRQITAPLPENPFHMTAATDGSGRFLLFWNATTFRNIPQLGRWSPHYHVTAVLRYLMTDREGKLLTPPHTVEQFEAELDYPSQTIRLFGIRPPAVTWFGDRFVLAWTRYDSAGTSDTRVLPVEADGDPIERRPLTVHSNAGGSVDTNQRPALGVAGSRLHLIWANKVSWRSWIAARSVTSTSELATPVEAAPIVRGSSIQSTVESGTGDGATFLAWLEQTSGEPRLRGRIARSDGSQSLLLEISQSARRVETPAVAFADGVWLVAWSEIEYKETASGEINRDLFTQHVLARRYDRGGAALDAAPLLLMREHVSPGLQWRGPAKISVGSSGAQFVVAWGGPPGGAYDRNVRVMRVGTDGTHAAEPLYVFSGGDATRGAPHALWTGSDYFVLWQEEPFQVTSPLFHVARSMRLGVNGQAAQSYPELAVTAAGSDIWPSPFEPATNGKEVLVTWSERRAQETGCVYAQRFTFDGLPLTAREELHCASGFGALPARSFAIWDGARFRVLYGHDNALWAHTIGSDERVKVFEAASHLTIGRPAVTPAGIVVPYTRVDPEYGAVLRAYRRTISFEPSRRRSVR